MHPIKQVVKDQFALLAFKGFKPNLKEFSAWYLTFGLFTAWLAGIGRYWDNPKAEVWQMLGLGSVIYCFFLSAIIFLLLSPLKPKHWSYKTVLIFISLTSLPALLYAIPVERFTNYQTAEKLNIWFLGVVALWRVALLFVFLNRSAKLSAFAIFVGGLLPIVIIINVLVFLNLEHAVFEIMAGIRPEEATTNDGAYQVLILITVLSNLLLPFLLMAYGYLVYKTRKE